MTIIWDFNGTILNDMQVCIDCMNSMLDDRGLARINLERYREVFTFPVREYYLALGFDFDKEPFEVPAHQFIDLYRENLYRAPLHDDIIALLEACRAHGFRQVILSAMEQEFLEDTLKSKGIFEFFDLVAGITNHLADGKLDMAKKLVANLGESTEEILLIGDTMHDYEVAAGSGIQCILIANGHQSLDRLRNNDCRVLKELKDLSSTLFA